MADHSELPNLEINILMDCLMMELITTATFSLWKLSRMEFLPEEVAVFRAGLTDIINISVILPVWTLNSKHHCSTLISILLGISIN